MCHMVSVTILPTERGLELLAAPSLISHMDIVYRYGLSPSETVFEVEWIAGERSPRLRFPPLFFFEEQIESWFLSNFPTRDRLIEVARDIAHGQIPEHIADRFHRYRKTDNGIHGRSYKEVSPDEYQRMWAMEAQLRQPSPVVTAAEIEQPIPVDVGWNSLSEELFGKVEVVG